LAAFHETLSVLEDLERNGTGTYGVIGLTKGPVNARCRRDVDDASVSLLDHQGQSGPRDLVRSSKMHVDHLVPFGIGHVGEGFVSQDAGVVDNLDSLLVSNVSVSECTDR
jgi:hypothetical protein